MQLYDITIAANTTRQLDAPGSYFYYYAGSAGGADATITLRGVSSGLRLILKPGQAFRLPQGNTETSWILTNYTNAATIIGSVMVGDGDITDNRVTGNVEVIDSRKNITLSSAAFSGLCEPIPTAGNFGRCQLWNLSTTKRIIVKKMTINPQADMSVNIGFGPQLANAVNNLFNKLQGGSASVVSQTRIENTASATLPTVSLYDIGMKSGVPFVWQPEEPLIIPPSATQGLSVNSYTPTGNFKTTFEVIEETA
jgi:hypothetical protein